MAQTEFSGTAPESMVNIFPNPCVGDTYLYTDDLEAAWVYIYDEAGELKAWWPIRAGKTLHIELQLKQGAYQLVLKNHFLNKLGEAKTLFISESH
jgi:hypothetical protein